MSNFDKDTMIVLKTEPKSSKWRKKFIRKIRNIAIETIQEVNYENFKDFTYLVACTIDGQSVFITYRPFKGLVKMTSSLEKTLMSTDEELMLTDEEGRKIYLVNMDVYYKNKKQGKGQKGQEEKIGFFGKIKKKLGFLWR